MPSKNVIIIDDDPSTKLVARRVSKRLDCEFLFFEKATQVLSNIGWIKPKLVVLDLMMTNMQGVFDDSAGIQIAKELRTRFGNLFPILILTGSENPKLITECLQAGADDHYVKSHDFTGLIKRIAAWLVVDYRTSDAQRERDIAANAMRSISTRDTHQGAAQESSQAEFGRGRAVGSNSSTELLAWRRPLRIS